MPFTLDPRIAQSSAPVATLRLCQARLQLDARWPWLVLVPAQENLQEMEDLSEVDRVLLMEETVRAGRAVRGIGEAMGSAVEKLNVATLGNVVPQLHVHIVGRRVGDPAWPGPVWGVGEVQAYGPAALTDALALAREVLGR